MCANRSTQLLLTRLANELASQSTAAVTIAACTCLLTPLLVFMGRPCSLHLSQAVEQGHTGPGDAPPVQQRLSRCSRKTCLHAIWQRSMGCYSRAWTWRGRRPRTQMAPRQVCRGWRRSAAAGYATSRRSRRASAWRGGRWCSLVTASRATSMWRCSTFGVWQVACAMARTAEDPSPVNEHEWGDDWTAYYSG